MTGSQTRYLLGAGVSMYGDWLTTVALLVLLFRLTGSAAAPAGYILVRVGPRVFAPILGGVLADRLSPTRILAVCWLTQGALTAAIVPISRTGSLAGIYLCVGVAQFLNALSAPCNGAIIPRLGQGGHIARINRLYAVSQASSVFIVPLVGSLILLAGPIDLLLLIDAASFLVGAAAVSSIRLRPREADAPSARRRRALNFHGLSRALEDPVLRVLLATFFAGAIVVTLLQATLVVVATTRLGNANQVGWLYSAVGLGGLIGGVVVLRWRPRLMSRRFLAVAGAIQVSVLGLFALISQLALDIPLLALSAVAGVLCETWGTIDLQERVDIRALGRVTSALDTALYAGMLTGAVLALGFSTVSTWQTVLAATSVASMAVIGLALWPHWRRALRAEVTDWAV